MSLHDIIICSIASHSVGTSYRSCTTLIRALVWTLFGVGVCRVRVEKDRMISGFRAEGSGFEFRVEAWLRGLRVQKFRHHTHWPDVFRSIMTLPFSRSD